MKECDDLQFLTKRYWDVCDEHGIDDQLKWYIAEKHPELGSKSLLQAELEHSRGSFDAEKTQRQTLVLLVGSPLTLSCNRCVFIDLRESCCF